MSFTKEMESHLKTMGWFLNRKISTYDEFMEKYNYPEFIREFIREYGGLKIKTLNKLQNDSILKEMFRISMNPLDSDGMEPDSVAEDWSNDIGRKLYVIGLYSPENFDIAVDGNGAVYFLGQDCYCLGKNIYQGLESIIRIDQWSSVQLDPQDSTSGVWYTSKGEGLDLDNYEFKYRTF
ncbi:MAG: SUKH-3 domain-containing protein [Limnohabitans sp.]|nr:SUKH-3 domain-containing protein [Limnohabitans sp.]